MAGGLSDGEGWWTEGLGLEGSGKDGWEGRETGEGADDGWRCSLGALHFVVRWEGSCADCLEVKPSE